jgi:hypothetical protein
MPDTTTGFGVVDPFAAMSMMSPANAGPRPVARQGGSMAIPATPTRAAAHTALLVAAAAMGSLLLVMFAMLTVVARRKRLQKPTSG